MPGYFILRTIFLFEHRSFAALLFLCIQNQLTPAMTPVTVNTPLKEGGEGNVR